MPIGRGLGPLSRPGAALLAALMGLGIALQFAYPTVPDVSWLFVVADKMLAGQRLYVDVIETNPPMSIFLYLPAVVLEHVAGLSAEVWQVVLTFALMVASLGLSARVMVRAGLGTSVERFLLAAVQALALLPMIVFAEREHIALIAILPAVVITAARADARPVAWLPAVIAGLGAGLAAAIKPHFALVLALPALYAALVRRSPRCLLTPEAIVAAAVVVGYAAVLWIGFHAYLDTIVPMLFETYRLERMDVLDLLLQPRLLAVVTLVLATLSLAGAEARSARVAVPLLAAAGFLIAYFEQGKGWRYHLYPAFALVYMVFFIVALPRLAGALGALRPGRGGTGASAGLAIGLAGVIAAVALMPLFSTSNRSALDLVGPVARLVPHPRVLAVSYYLSIGHPLTRMVGGTWVGSHGSQWLGSAATYRSLVPGIDAATTERMAYWIAHDRALIAHDIREGRPDVILADKVGYDWDEMVAKTPGMAELLGGYAKAGEADGVELLIRTDLLPRSGRIVAATD